MRLHRFEIRNFKSIRNASLEWDDLLVLIGENNCGKSSVLAALDVFLSGSAIRSDRYFHRFQTGPDDAIELVGHFDQLSDAEQEEVAVRGRMNGNEWILKKRFWLESEDDPDDAKGMWKEQYYSYSSREIFSGWPSPDTSWNNFPDEYQPVIQQIPNRPARPSNDARETLRALVRQHRPELVENGAPEWIPNPGGGGNWKSNANSVIPRMIFVRAIHDVTDEAEAKDASAYGKLINLIIEKQLSQRQEFVQLRDAFQRVMELFQPDAQHPERQAQEIRDLEQQITQGLQQVIGGQALIRTEMPEVSSVLLPSTSLVIRDPIAHIETGVADQGHGLQRALLMTLLQLLAQTQDETSEQEGDSIRATVFSIEEPELYMHPQMERRMRDVLYDLSARSAFQVACTTHSPIFLDIVDKYSSIVRMVRTESGEIAASQVTSQLFAGAQEQVEKDRLQTVARFNPGVNELFFSNQVVLFEESSAIAAFERAAELTGVFQRYPRLRREVCAVDCYGKTAIPGFQRILNAFRILYRVLHDEDRSNPTEFARNVTITAAAQTPLGNAPIHLLSLENLEGVLGYQVPGGMSKTVAAVGRVEELFAQGSLPLPFLEAMNFVYFGSVSEPPPI